jgi:alkylhydroperoxidase family enzyme
MRAHGAVASKLRGKSVTEAVLADYRTAPIDERLKLMLAFIEELDGTPDARPLLDAGVDRRAIEEALAVVAMFETITRLADAFGFALQDEAGFDAGARSLLRFGYEL